MQISSPLKRYLPNALLFLVIVVMLLVVQWNTNAHRVLHEQGDFAANSLLILKAKHLHLLYGNYSRIGVHHPGPAIMYVLAAGEALFHDLLHVVPSPFSGQLLAVCFYSAAWIVLIFSIVRGMVGKMLPALLFTMAFTAALGMFESVVFLGAWFPDLYILPFAAVVVAISRLAFGHTDRLRALAVSSGFVINGHVSFIPMLGVMLITMLAANWIISRRDPDKRILSAAFLARHRRDILIAVGILFLFFVPLLILTVTEFPGPLYDYVKFGGNNKHNTLKDSLAYVSVYWQTGYAYYWGALLVVLLLTGLRARATPFLRDARGLGIALIAASLAALVYAKIGIDYLDLKYLELFYYSVPALAGGLALLYLYEAFRWKGRALLAGLLSIAGLVLTYQATLVPSYYDENYNVYGSAQLYERLRALPGKGRIVIDIEQNGGDWDYVWGAVDALQLYALRQGDDLICVNEHWHILFTREGRCRPEELDTPRRFLARATRTERMVDIEPDVEGQGLLLYRHGRMPKPLAYDTVLEHKDAIRKILGKGWADPETDFAWSMGPVAELELPADPHRRRQLRLILGSFLPVKSFSQHVDAFANGKPAGSWDFDNFQPRRQVTLDLGDDPGAAQHIELRIAHPASPKQYGLSVDARLLGVSLYGIK